jgi:hypothetical protein
MSVIPGSYRKIHVLNKQAMSFAEQAEIVEVATELPGSGEVLIKVLFTGIEASDILQNTGEYGPLMNEEPEVQVSGKLQRGDCGSEGVGEIIATGEGVDFQVGDTVIFAGFGVSFREYLTCATAQVFSLPVPATPDLTAIPISAATAACGIDINGRLHEGERVLVTGAAGGTGQFAVQWAKVKYNAYVVGVCGSADKEKMLREIGCDDTINYKQAPDMASAIRLKFPDGIDVAYDGIGGSLRDAVWENMAVFGRMICIGSVGDDYQKQGAFNAHKIASNSVVFKSLTCTGFFLGNLFNDPRLAQTIGELMQYIGEKKISVSLDPASSEFHGLEGVYRAQEHMRRGVNTGKVYVTL